MTEQVLGAFIIGLMGTGHCIGMCGGIAAAITVGMPQQQNPSRWLYLLTYNLGRLSAYGLFGAIIGGAFSQVNSFSANNEPLIVLRLIAALMLILLGLYIGQWWMGLTKLEQVGTKLWRHISPHAHKLLPLSSPAKAIPFGFLWGWLPCGLVYSTLSWAALSGSALNGGITMLAFGLGTLPAMFLMGSFADKLYDLLRKSLIKRTSALLLILFGVHTGYIAINQLC